LLLILGLRRLLLHSLRLLLLLVVKYMWVSPHLSRLDIWLGLAWSLAGILSCLFFGRDKCWCISIKLSSRCALLYIGSKMNIRRGCLYSLWNIPIKINLERSYWGAPAPPAPWLAAGTGVSLI
jgi:hypothetical protein